MNFDYIKTLVLNSQKDNDEISRKEFFVILNTEDYVFSVYTDENGPIRKIFLSGKELTDFEYQLEKGLYDPKAYDWKTVVNSDTLEKETLLRYIILMKKRKSLSFNVSV